MTTTYTIDKISANGELVVKLPDKLPPGEHPVVVVVNDAPGQAERLPLEFSAYPAAPVSAQNTFRREDIYSDDGRSGGKQVHDANIVATMRVHSVPRLLTHNVRDFARFGAVIEVVPLEV